MSLAGSEYVIEMLNITKEFPGIKANDNITLQLRRGEIHALLGDALPVNPALHPPGSLELELFQRAQEPVP